jgi:hypothetical protein
MIAGLEKHALAPVAALCDMVRRTRNDDAGKTGQTAPQGTVYFLSAEKNPQFGTRASGKK